MPWWGPQLLLLLAETTARESRHWVVDARGNLLPEARKPAAELSLVNVSLVRRDAAPGTSLSFGAWPWYPQDHQELAQLEQRAAPKPGNHSSPGNESAESLHRAKEERESMSTLTYVFFPAALVLAVLFEAVHFPWAEVDWSLPLDRSDGLEGSEKVDSSFAGLTVLLARRGWGLARIYFFGAGRVKGRCYLGLLVAIHLLGMYLDLAMFDFQQRYWNLYQQPSLPLFFELIRNWFILHIARMITYVYEFYVEDMFFLHWRDHLTRYFEAIWVPSTYVFKMQEGSKFDNPDQRIHVDIASFITQSYSLTFGVMKVLVNLGMYTYMLATITPASMHWASLVGTALLYSLVGSCVMHFVGSELAHFSWLGERLGGDFRGELRRVYDQSETVASIRSEEAELQRLQHRFERIKLNTWLSMLLEKRLSLFQKWYGPLREVLFMCILAPFFIRGEVSLGRLKQCETALDRISDALSFLVDNYSKLSSYRATVDRLHNFRGSCLTYLSPQKLAEEDETKGALDADVIERLAARGIPPTWPRLLGGMEFKEAPVLPPPRAARASALCLHAEGLRLPSGRALFGEVHLEVAPGEMVLVCGEEGSGKSTILKALAGMWPYMDPRDGTVSQEDVVLLPQKPRLPMPMSLHEAVAFPHGADRYTEEAVRAALERVGLAELLTKGLATQLDVNSTLSGGEFQRLLVAHCLLARPSWVLLDESMAHMSAASRAELYELLADQLVKGGTGVVSTCHNHQELACFHDRFYRVE
ncbi:ABCC2, partial [Symbiodinium natans]